MFSRQMTDSADSRFDMRCIELALVLLLSTSLFAQQTAQQTEQQNSDPQKPAESAATAPTTTTFKTRSDLVLVPVVVRDRKGKNVSGLSKEMFRLEENGKEQAISLFEEVQPAGTDSTTAPPVDRGYSNLPFDNAGQLRLTIIVLDLLNTTPFQRQDGRDHLVTFLSKGLAPNQPVSLVCLTSKGLKPVHPVTTDTNALVQALRKMPLGAETLMSGQNPRSPAISQYRENLAFSTVAQITEIAQAYVGIPGRKSLIFAAGSVNELATENEIIDSSVLANDLRKMWRNLIEANISIYTVALMDWTRNPARRGPVGGLDLRLTQFADSTGGNPCVEANGLMSCLAEAVNDSRSYYMLGFSVQPDDRKPGWRSLKVKVSAEHANVRARNGFYYGTPPLETPKRPQEINALASPLPQSAVPMYVKVLPSPAGAAQDSAPAGNGKTTVAFLMTIPTSSVTFDPSRQNPLDLEVGAIALTNDAKEAAEFLHPVLGKPTPENLKQWAQEGIRLQEKLDLAPGSYDLRFFARDNNTDQIGTVVFSLDVK